MFEEKDIVSISYDDLVRNTSLDDSGVESLLIDSIAEAFGASGLGIIAIRDVPNFQALRSRLLPLSQRLATLSNDQLDQITVPESIYQVGWSYGKEKLEGQLDMSKGSFYANPLTDNLYDALIERDFQHGRECHHISVDQLKQTAIENPAFFAPNVWPSSSIPELEDAFKEMGLLICHVGRILARLCDDYVATQCPGYEKSLEKFLTKSLSCKGRLLHYFPLMTVDPDISDNKEGGEDRSFSNWCGWHNDHGSLTGLVPAIYMDSNGRIIDCPDQNAGLYIKSRNGSLVHAVLPKGSLAFQVGETSQIFTGGILKATPHAVRGCDPGNEAYAGITRESFAVFMELEYHDELTVPPGNTITDAQNINDEEFLPSSVKPLRTRWRPGMNFGAFSDATFSSFY